VRVEKHSDSRSGEPAPAAKEDCFDFEEETGFERGAIDFEKEETDSGEADFAGMADSAKAETGFAMEGIDCLNRLQMPVQLRLAFRQRDALPYSPAGRIR